MRVRFALVPLVAAAFVIVVTAGCSDSSAPRSILRVESINDNTPLQSDVVSFVGGQPTVKEDAVTVQIWNQPHDEILDLYASPYGAVMLDRYEVRFEGTESIPSVTGALGWAVDANRIMSGTIVVVPAAHKLRAPLLSLAGSGEIQSTARITFYGRETGSDHAVKFETVLQVNFANWAD